MTQPFNGTLGPPPTTSTPLDTGRVVTELSGTSIDLGNVVLEDPSTGLPFVTQDGGLPTYVVGPNPLPVTVQPAAQSLYLAAGTVAGITAAGGSQALAAAGATVHLAVFEASIIPNAALTGTPALWVELRSGSAVLAGGVVSFGVPLVIPLGNVPFPGTSLALFYGPNSGSLDLHYTIAGVTP